MIYASVTSPFHRVANGNFNCIAFAKGLLKLVRIEMWCYRGEQIKNMCSLLFIKWGSFKFV